MLQFGGSEADKPRVDTFSVADRSYEADQKSASSRDGSVANGVGLNSANNFRSVEYLYSGYKCNIVLVPFLASFHMLALTIGAYR